MSLNSSAEPLHYLIQRSLALLRRDNPGGYDEMMRAAGTLAVSIRVGSETCGVEFADRVSVSEREVEHPDVEIKTDRPAVAAVMAGEMSLPDALDTDHLRVRGSMDAVVRAHDGLLAFVAAAVHSPPQQQFERSFSARST